VFWGFLCFFSKLLANQPVLCCGTAHPVAGAGLSVFEPDEVVIGPMSAWLLCP